MRIGILGGTFNPVHNGHLHVARQVLKKLGLNRVIFVPTYIPPHKKIAGNAKPADRLAMLKLATRGQRQFSVLDYEIRQRRTSYSIRTVSFLKSKFGKNARLFFLIGADSLPGLNKWKNIKKLRGLAQFVAVPRHGHNLCSCPSSVIELNIKKKKASSSNIRFYIRNRKPVGGLIPREVLSYIEKKGLYGK